MNEFYIRGGGELGRENEKGRKPYNPASALEDEGLASVT
jgi:hypothetical protein